MLHGSVTRVDPIADAQAGNLSSGSRARAAIEPEEWSRSHTLGPWDEFEGASSPVPRLSPIRPGGVVHMVEDISER